MSTETEQELLTFPCVFPIKVMGSSRKGLADDINDCVASFVTATEMVGLETRLSSKGNYMAVTVRINASSKKQLDGIYMALQKINGVKFIL